MLAPLLLAGCTDPDAEEPADALSHDPWRSHDARFAVVSLEVQTEEGWNTSHPAREVEYDLRSGTVRLDPDPAEAHALVVLRAGNESSYLLEGPGTIFRLIVGPEGERFLLYLWVGPNATGPESTRPHLVDEARCPVRYEGPDRTFEGEGIGWFGELPPGGVTTVERMAQAGRCSYVGLTIRHEGIWRKEGAQAVRG